MNIIIKLKECEKLNYSEIIVKTHKDEYILNNEKTKITIDNFHELLMGSFEIIYKKEFWYYKYPIGYAKIFYREMIFDKKIHIFDVFCSKTLGQSDNIFSEDRIIIGKCILRVKVTNKNGCELNGININEQHFTDSVLEYCNNNNLFSETYNEKIDTTLSKSLIWSRYLFFSDKFFSIWDNFSELRKGSIKYHILFCTGLLRLYKLNQKKSIKSKERMVNFHRIDINDQYSEYPSSHKDESHKNLQSNYFESNNTKNQQDNLVLDKEEKIRDFKGVKCLSRNSSTSSQYNRTFSLSKSICYSNTLPKNGFLLSNFISPISYLDFMDNKFDIKKLFLMDYLNQNIVFDDLDIIYMFCSFKLRHLNLDQSMLVFYDKLTKKIQKNNKIYFCDVLGHYFLNLIPFSDEITNKSKKDHSRLILDILTKINCQNIKNYCIKNTQKYSCEFKKNDKSSNDQKTSSQNKDIIANQFKNNVLSKQLRSKYLFISTFLTYDLKSNFLFRTSDSQPSLLYLDGNRKNFKDVRTDSQNLTYLLYETHAKNTNKYKYKQKNNIISLSSLKIHKNGEKCTNLSFENSRKKSERDVSKHLNNNYKIYKENIPDAENFSGTLSCFPENMDDINDKKWFCYIYKKFFFAGSAYNNYFLTIPLKRNIVGTNVKEQNRLILEITGIAEDDILIINQKEDNFSAPHVIFFDSQENEIVISLRGTQSHIDAFKDLDCKYSRFFHGFGHSGIIKSAFDFVDRYKEKLINIYNLKKAKSILFTGHSLGGAIASCIYIILSKKKTYSQLNLRAITFGTPPFLSKNFCGYYYYRIINIIYGFDIVPTLSFGSVLDLKYKCISLSINKFSAKSNSSELILYKNKKCSINQYDNRKDSTINSECKMNNCSNMYKTKLYKKDKMIDYNNYIEQDNFVCNNLFLQKNTKKQTNASEIVHNNLSNNDASILNKSLLSEKIDELNCKIINRQEINCKKIYEKSKNIKKPIQPYKENLNFSDSKKKNINKKDKKEKFEESDVIKQKSFLLSSCNNKNIEENETLDLNETRLSEIEEYLSTSDIYPKLYIPGKIFHITKNFKKNAGKNKGCVQMQVKERKFTFFSKIFVHYKMLVHHNISSYINALKTGMSCEHTK